VLPADVLQHQVAQLVRLGAALGPRGNADGPAEVGQGHQLLHRLRTEAVLVGLLDPSAQQLLRGEPALGPPLLDDPGVPAAAHRLQAGLLHEPGLELGDLGGPGAHRLDERGRHPPHLPGHPGDLSALLVFAVLQPALDLEAALAQEVGQVAAGLRRQLRPVLGQGVGVQRPQLPALVQGAYEQVVEVQLGIGHPPPLGTHPGSGVHGAHRHEVLSLDVPYLSGGRIGPPDEGLLPQHPHDRPVGGHGHHRLQLVLELLGAHRPEGAHRLGRRRDGHVEGGHPGAIPAGPAPADELTCAGVLPLQQGGEGGAEDLLLGGRLPWLGDAELDRRPLGGVPHHERLVGLGVVVPGRLGLGDVGHDVPGRELALGGLLSRLARRLGSDLELGPRHAHARSL
jgi:hypothetical protein